MNIDTTTPLKIAVNTRLLMKDKLEGIGWYKYHVLKNWVENHPQHTFYFIFDRPYHEEFIFGDNVKPIVASPPARHPILWYLWYEVFIPKIIRQIQPDIFVSLDAYTSLRANCKKMTTIHDIAFILHDHHMPKLTQWYMRYFTPKYIVASDSLITVSQATKEDIIKHFHYTKNICVAYNAPSHLYKPLTDNQIDTFKNKHISGSDFFLFVGSIHPRKNVKKQLEAFEYYKNKYKSNTKFVLIGRKAWQYKDVEEYLLQMKHKKDVIQIPHSTPSEISQWMGASTALIMVSLYEGFGVPLVEAMACQVPIICSNTSSLPEVANGAAIHVSPDNYKEIGEAMHTISTDMLLRDRLITSGISQLSRFDWKKTADILWHNLIETIQK